MVDDTEILSTYWAGGQSCYATDEGTSMATPFVSGTLALLLGRGLSPQNAVQTMLATLNKSVTCGAGQGCQGLVNAAAAMGATGQQAAPPSRTQSVGASSSPGAANASAPAPGHGATSPQSSRPAPSSGSGSAFAPSTTGAPSASGQSGAPSSHTAGALSMSRVARSAAAAHQRGGSGPWAWLFAILGAVIAAATVFVWRRYTGLHVTGSGVEPDASESVDDGSRVLARR
jgi:subtilisin family serine protease